MQLLFVPLLFGARKKVTVGASFLYVHQIGTNFDIFGPGVEIRIELSII